MVFSVSAFLLTGWASAECGSHLRRDLSSCFCGSVKLHTKNSAVLDRHVHYITRTYTCMRHLSGHLSMYLCMARRTCLSVDVYLSSCFNPPVCTTLRVKITDPGHISHLVEVCAESAGRRCGSLESSPPSAYHRGVLSTRQEQIRSLICGCFHVCLYVC